MTVTPCNRCADCGHEFTPGELRYRADDGHDYCTPNGCGQRRWAAENPAN